MASKNSSPIKREYILHLVLWGGVLLFPYIKFIEREGGYPETFLHELNSILFIVIPSYAFYFWWLPLIPEKRWRWLPSLIIIFVGSILGYEFTDSLFHGGNFQPFSWKQFLSDVVKNSAFILFFLALYLIKRSLNQKHQLDLISNEQVQAEQTIFEAKPGIQAPDEVHYIYADKTTYKVKSSEILFLKAEVDYVKVVTRDREILVLDSLRRWKEVLSNQGFLQAHRSYLVRVDAILSISKGKIELEGHTLPVGPSYKQVLLEAFKNRGS
ncbi:LytTR family DNA-binding domain-containing protein [Roseivirga sp. E12]|uniref:LytR/AlgR family response regulator transcription factor n=1 Tax=Roseivirga sp. E12 TaxID=2819237 RepID=UPI001ABC48D0|nr:LytTR family DNA-binding domain-containing protein [Roseivirga sp. E12]MBO3697163.1 LytTR family transcriptional regulator [Roseivirga sp. E12]